MSTPESIKRSTVSKYQENYKYKVSIIVPCYNTKPWLDECLQSLVDQTLENIEIICINDGSTDGTGKKLDEWQTQYPAEIKVIHLQKNDGLSNARNTGMKIAQGECIGFVDSDDFVNVTMYENLYKAYKDNNADVVMSNYITFINKKPKMHNNNNLASAKKEDAITMFFENKKAIWTGLYKSSYLQQHKINFIDSFYYAEDYPFLFDVAIHNPTLFILPEITYYYRIQRIGSLTENPRKKVYTWFAILDYMEIKNINSHNKKKHIKEKLLKFTVHTLVTCFIYINMKYKINFLLQTAKHVFKNKKISHIYKIIIATKYHNFTNYPKAIVALLLLHACYLWQKLPFIKLKNYDKL